MPTEDRFSCARGLIEARQNILPKNLIDPGPSPGQLNELLSMAGAAPDHGQLTPWRFVIVPLARREALGEAFALAVSDRVPDATPVQLAMAREKAYRAPFLMLAVARLDRGESDVPHTEHLVSLGAALQNVLLAAHAMGFGAGLTSGRSLTSPRLRELFGLTDSEAPVCFLSIGTAAKHKLPRVRPHISAYTSSL